VSLLSNLASGNQVDAGIGDISPSIPVMVCGNGVGALGDASAACGTGGTAQPSRGGGSTSTGGSDDEGTVSTGGVSPSVPVTVCGNGVGLLGDASVACTADTSTGGTTAPPPGTTTPGGSTDTDGTTGTPGSTGTSGVPGTTGLTPGTSGGAGDPTHHLRTAAPVGRRLQRPAVHRGRQRPGGPGRGRAAGGGRADRAGRPARHRRDGRR
jgi:hypothetical protein